MKLTINPKPLTTYKQLNDSVLLVFSSTDVIWLIERKLYAKIEKDRNAQLDFVLQKFEITEK